MKNGKKIKIAVAAAAAVIIGAALAAAMTFAFRGGENDLIKWKKDALDVGTDVPFEDITEFYYTVDASTYPPYFQRYRFYTENGKYYFYHEKREGDHWPLTGDDITLSGTRELTQDERDKFFGYLDGGKVKKRSESVETGGSGPWLYLYWKGDRSDYQEFSFASYGLRLGFEEFCVSLAGKE